MPAVLSLIGEVLCWTSVVVVAPSLINYLARLASSRMYAVAVRRVYRESDTRHQGGRPTPTKTPGFVTNFGSNELMEFASPLLGSTGAAAAVPRQLRTLLPKTQEIRNRGLGFGMTRAKDRDKKHNSKCRLPPAPALPSPAGKLRKKIADIGFLFELTRSFLSFTLIHCRRHHLDRELRIPVTRFHSVSSRERGEGYLVGAAPNCASRLLSYF